MTTPEANEAREAMRNELDRMRAEIASLKADRKRYQWAANELLACDYGDNDKPGEHIGWRVYGWRDRSGNRRIYGPSIDAAIDSELNRAPSLLDQGTKP